MTTSGTATFNVDLGEALEEAFERAGLEFYSGYDFATGRRTMNFLMADWASRGLNFWTIDLETTTLVAGTAEITCAADTVDVLDMMLRTGSGTSQQDLQINRIPFPTYANISNKNITGRPIQAMITRGTAAVTITLWPVPDGSTTYTLAYYRLRRMEDAGTGGTSNPDVPFRFIPALISGLAYHIALKKSKDAERIIGLKALYDEDFRRAAAWDQDRSSWFIRPSIR
jgi:hypothetical protein